MLQFGIIPTSQFLYVITNHAAYAKKNKGSRLHSQHEIQKVKED